MHLHIKTSITPAPLVKHYYNKVMNNPYQHTPAHFLRENLKRTRRTYAQELNLLHKTTTAREADAARASAYRARIYNKIIILIENELERRGLSLSELENAEMVSHSWPNDMQEVN